MPATEHIFYTRLQRRLHWLVILMVAFQYGSQLPMKHAMEAAQRQEALTWVQFLVTTLHTWGGAAIAAIMIWRWQLRKRQVKPAAGQLSPLKEKWVRLHHILLYATLLLMALSGVLHYYVGIQWAATVHESGKWLLLAFIGVHIVGALLHIGGNNTVFHRMMGWGGLR